MLCLFRQRKHSRRSLSGGAYKPVELMAKVSQGVQGSDMDLPYRPEHLRKFPKEEQSETLINAPDK